MKPKDQYDELQTALVAPRAGAWIETPGAVDCVEGRRSRPAPAPR